jgi:hypothetical protein
MRNLIVAGAFLLALATGGGVTSAQTTKALAQPTQSASSNEPPLTAWTLLGIDVDVQNRWRAAVRVGHLGDIDSRVWITDLIFVARPAIHLLVGYVYVQPSAADSAGTTLARAGATWVPLRRRLAIDNRFLFERRSSKGTSTVTRGRSRVRISWSSPGPLTPSVFASIEAIGATGAGLVEKRIQLGVAKSVGRMSGEVYWLQRRIRERPVFNGVGLTASYRIGT